MIKWVLDSSAILAVMLQEKGCENVVGRFEDSCISTVNLTEVLLRLADRNQLTKQDVLDFHSLGVSVVDFDIEQAMKAAQLRSQTRNLGLSLGDRCCLALAIVRDATAITADREWKKLKVCKVESIC